ncbi:class II fructose-bisphosphate aldolase [Candidatus Riesia pediculischaeffi]|uniref:Fructose-bisphosphate aldolase n=1 Tax=Candidatus Riesia pediculischaeffi PTSU TaxID=1401651 RepID=A0A0C1VJ53_9ENTR|nr:class II fructose-bisphosphate aldolase [Candidatus Riesia pediculischaeffi]KIE63850.1 Fructose-bisphosphate aldolase class II [Candidatus Riesia pediculischaeffi PTSU]
MSEIFDKLNHGVILGNDVQRVFSTCQRKKIAIPAINCIGTDSINATLESSARFNLPIIIQFSYEGSRFISGKGLRLDSHRSAVLGSLSGANHVHQMAKHYGASVILHTDHCSKENLPWIDELLEFGEKHHKKYGKPFFSSHMIDLSSESLSENVQICSEYFRRMSKIGMTIEIELGCTGGEEDGVKVDQNLKKCSLYTSPEDVLYAYEELSKISNKFIIAASIGNVHGVYRDGNVQLDPRILEISQKKIGSSAKNDRINFVFHGGSGCSAKMIRKVIDYGVVKVNIDTDIQWATWLGVLNYYGENEQFLQGQLGNPLGEFNPNKKFYDPRSWIRRSQLSMINRIKRSLLNMRCI